jgi:ankyrin repeat protein
VVSRHGETALHYATRTGNEDLVRLLIIAGADVNVRGRAGSPYDVCDPKFESLRQLLTPTDTVVAAGTSSKEIPTEASEQQKQSPQ